MNKKWKVILLVAFIISGSATAFAVTLPEGVSKFAALVVATAVPIGATLFGILTSEISIPVTVGALFLAFAMDRSITLNGLSELYTLMTGGSNINSIDSGLLSNLNEGLNNKLGDYLDGKEKLPESLKAEYKQLERNAEKQKKNNEEEESGDAEPHVYTWANLLNRDATAKDADPGADLESQDELYFGAYLKEATYPRRLIMGSAKKYLNIYLPKLPSKPTDSNNKKDVAPAMLPQTQLPNLPSKPIDLNDMKDIAFAMLSQTQPSNSTMLQKKPGKISVNKAADLTSDGGFFWSESSNMIYVGENQCIELSNDAPGFGAVTLKTCTLDKPAQMWSPIVVKTSTDNGAPVQVAYESVAYPRVCIGSSPSAGMSSLFPTSCYIKPTSGSKSILDPDVVISYESELGLQPLETTTFKYNHTDHSYDAQHTSFHCIQSLYIAKNPYEDMKYFGITDLSNACPPILNRVPRAETATTTSTATSVLVPPTVINDQINFLSDQNTNGSQTLAVKRDHFYGTPALPPLLPGQWRNYIINIGQGSFSIVDGYGWLHPVIIDMGSSSGVATSGSVAKHGAVLLEFMQWLLQSGTSTNIKLNEAAKSVSAVERRPILIVSHADRDHYNLLEYMFQNKKIAANNTEDYVAITPLPVPFAVYIGGGLESFHGSTSENSLSSRTRKWLKSLADNADVKFYQKLTFKGNELYSTNPLGTETQIDAAIPLLPPDGNSTIRETVGTNNRYDRPWLYFLESDPTAKEKNRNSLIVSIADQNYSFTAPGDAEDSNETAAIARAKTFGILSRAGLMLASHHGSGRSGNQKDFYQNFASSTVIFSAGFNKSYGHPTLAAYERIRSAGKILCLTPDGKADPGGKYCKNTNTISGFGGGNAQNFLPGAGALFMTQTQQFDDVRKSNILPGGDIVVTVTPIGGMLSKFYSTKKIADQAEGVVVDRPAIEYYFTNHMTTPKTAGVTTTPPLRSSAALLYGTKQLQSIYCAKDYFNSVFKDDINTKLSSKLGAIKNYSNDYDSAYTTKTGNVYMKNFKFDISTKTDTLYQTTPKDIVKTLIPIPSINFTQCN